MKNKTGKPVKCNTCGYGWLTQSKMYYVPCPRCRRIVKIRDIKKITDQKKEETEK